MASLAFGIVGGLLFGPVGFLIGSLLGNLLFPQRVQGPRLSNLKLQDSSYGMMIPIVYGTMRVPGIVIWQTDLKEHTHHSGGKGGPDVTTYSYSASFACYLCEGVMEGGLRRIWADGKLIYDINAGSDGSGAPSDLPCTVYQGDESQLPDPTMESELGTGNVPAYRGIAYVVFDDWDLTNYGNRIPNLNFEVAMKGGQESKIFKVAEYHNNPVHQWCYSAVGGFSSDVGTQFPYITQWGLNTAGIHVYSEPAASDPNPSLNVYTYDNSSLQQTGHQAPNVPPDLPVVSPVTAGGGANFGWAPIGTYVYSDLSTTPLWYYGNNNGLVGTTTTNNAIGSGSAGIVGGSVTCAVNFAFTAGVPSTEYVINTALSADGKTLLVMTGPTTGFPRPTKWYRIVNGVVSSNGTIAANLNIIGIGASPLRYSSTLSGQASFHVSVLENNGEFLWCYTGGTDYQPKTTGPHYAGSVGWITVFKIDPGTGILDWDSTASAATLTNPNETGLPYPAICSPADGYAGVVQGASIGLFSRVSGLGQTLLSEIVEDVSERAGLAPTQLDVTALTPIVDGYMLTDQKACRDNITPLQSAWYFDGVESSGVMKFVLRGAPPALTIPDSDLAAQTPGGTAPALVTTKRVQEVDLPAILDVKYVNAANDYQTGDQISQRQVVESQLRQTIELTINMSDTKAKQVANTLLFTAWIERNQFTFLTSRQYDYLEPTDVVSVHGYELRIMQKKNLLSGVIQFDGVAAVTSIWNQGPTAVSGSGFSPSVPTASQPTTLELLDTPLVLDTDQAIGLYAGMAGQTSDKWPGAAIYESSDGGSTYSNVISAGVPTVMGSVAAIPGAFAGGNIFDESNSITVEVGNGGGELASAAELAVLNGANLALVGNEYIQFKNALLTAPSTYELTGLLRGRRGTEYQMGSHIVDEPFVLMNPVTDVPMVFADLGQQRFWKAVTFGTTPQSVTGRSFLNNGARLRPYAPVDLVGGLDSSGDTIIDWTRRTRIGGAWADFTDVPLSEPSELYVLQVWDATFTICARVVTGLTAPTFTYTVAMQTADFGRAQSTIYVTVGQLGTFGLGIQAFAALVGSGSHIDTPSTPKQPFNTLPPPAPPAAGCNVSGTVTNVTVTMALGVQQYFSPSDFGPNDAWVFKFVVPASPSPWVISFNAAEYLGSPTPRNAAFSLSPCGVPVIPSLETLGSLNVGWTFVTGVNQNASGQFQLQPSTTYYLTITTTAVSEMIANINIRAKVA